LSIAEQRAVGFILAWSLVTLQKAGIKTLRDEEWEIENGIVMKKGRIYVLERELRRKII